MRAFAGAVAVFVLVVTAIFFAVRVRYAGKPAVRLGPKNCDATLWNHVYEKRRLRVVEPCTVIEGRVVSTVRSWDGDLHIDLDPVRKSVLNPVNAFHSRGALVVEIVCEHVPSRPDAEAACSGFQSQVAIPKINDHIRVTGAYVTDLEHGWREIHPATRIDILGSGR